ncbi:hypothetical protein RT41_GL001849 [Lactococcus fujiensis JCM 16395]|uniref:Uncharacterized protein n=1 Tax=Lactococcus fujiensis JCM 16395 TaxID=1291764 RepID=A0A2A5RJY9_9LACT|nr:hypothetical protein RT41_GL001849 [Lactococcus fujiensis JCM 16395]
MNFDNGQATSNLTEVLVPSQHVLIAAALGVHDEVAGK